MVVLFVLCLVFKSFVLLAPYVCFHIFSYVKVTEWQPIGKKLLIRLTICFHCISTCLVVVVFFPPRFLSGNLFLIAPFPDLCLLVPF